jgi:hypothetical protein
VSDLKHTSAVVERDDIMYPSAIPFVLVHLACIAVFWTGVSFQALAICLLLYWLRIFGIGAGYHRYFSHRAYRTGRVFQFILAILSQNKRACCGGRQSIAITTSTQTPRWMSIRRAKKGSSIVTSDGFSHVLMTRPI